jgi:pimeloyl-ACP methyl ester carboxylesterase
MMSETTIYKSTEGEAELLALYDSVLNSLGIEYEERMLETRFGSTHILVSGPKNAPPVVLLHGGNSFAPMTLAWFVPLTKDYRVYVPDVIGHPGKSAQTRVSSRDESYGQWIVDVLDGLEFKQADFIASSFGAGILLRAAAHAPERISKTVLHVPSGVINVPLLSMVFKIGLPFFLYKWFPNPKRLLKAVAWMSSEELEEETLKVLSATFLHVKVEMEMPRPATKEELERFNAPTLVIAGENDVMFPGQKVIARARDIFPNLVAAECLSGSCHFPSKKDIEFINQRIHRFLKRSQG